MKKMVLIVALICLATLGVNHKALAAEDWQLCTVTGAGGGGTSTICYFSLTYQGNPVTRGAILDPDRSKELLAVALTAMASGQKVKAWFDPANQPNVWVGWMYLTNEP